MLDFSGSTEALPCKQSSPQARLLESDSISLLHLTIGVVGCWCAGLLTYTIYMSLAGLVRAI